MHQAAQATQRCVSENMTKAGSSNRHLAVNTRNLQDSQQQVLALDCPSFLQVDGDDSSEAAGYEIRKGFHRVPAKLDGARLRPGPLTAPKRVRLFARHTFLRSHAASDVCTNTALG